MKKITLILILALFFAQAADAAKWQTLVFSEDVNLGLLELDRYCMLHDVSAADVLWANSINSSADIKAGTSIYLPANQADLLGIWQNQGAWKPTALVPVTSAAAANRIAVEHEKKVEAKKAKQPKDLFQNEAKITNKDTAELQAKLNELGGKKTSSPNEEKSEQRQPEVAQANPTPLTASSNSHPEIIREMKVEAPKPSFVPAPSQQTPQAAIAQLAKPDAVLMPQKKAQASNASPLTANSQQTDPIIVLSPNGNASQGPMRLLIVGDKVEVVKIPENAVPRTPTMADLDHVFGTSPEYLPYYNMTKRPLNDDYRFNFANPGGKMMWPVDGRVSSYFGWRGKRKHEGIDIPMPANTPIRAARNGVVAKTGNNSTMGFRGYGNFVLLDHGGGLQSFYAHCSSVAVKPGQRIMQGQIVGYVGSTGRSTANHLHFEVRVNNAKVDPMPYLGGNSHVASRK